MNQVSSGIAANPTGTTIAWVVGGLVVGGGLLWLITRPKKPAPATAPVIAYQRVAGIDPSSMFMVAPS